MIEITNTTILKKRIKAKSFITPAIKQTKYFASYFFEDFKLGELVEILVYYKHGTRTYSCFLRTILPRSSSFFNINSSDKLIKLLVVNIFNFLFKDNYVKYKSYNYVKLKFK